MTAGGVSDPPPNVVGMIIDCGTCTAAPVACGDCVVTLLLGIGEGAPELSAEHERAVGVLADSGLVPPLRLVRPA